ncbi:hypothetical protein PRJ_Dakar_00360 [Faustovirus]|nr:hypothetical protein PRJ_Dakar_00360 [Faustovirus]QKE50244.1 hypothetical protein F-VV10_0124 [Faustovirus]
MDYNLKGKSPSVASRPVNTTPTGSPRVGFVGALHSPRTVQNTNVLGGILAPKVGGANPKQQNDKKVSTDPEIKEKLTGYVQVEQAQWGRLPPGTHIRYFARGDGTRASRFRTGGFIVSWTKSANGKVYLKIANKLEFTNRQAGYRDFSVDAANVAEIWAKPEVVDKVKNEPTPNDLIKQLVEEVAALKVRITALERKK